MQDFSPQAAPAVQEPLPSAPNDIPAQRQASAKAASPASAETESLSGLSRSFIAHLGAPLGHDGQIMDVLIVVDSSNSMKANLNKLGQRLMSLLSHISDYDVQIGFILAEFWKAEERSGSLMPLELSFPRGSEEWRDLASIFRHWRRNKPIPFAANHARRGIYKTVLTPSMPNFQQIFQNTLSSNPLYYAKRAAGHSGSRGEESPPNAAPLSYGETQDKESLKKLQKKDKKHVYFSEGGRCDFPPFCASHIERPLAALVRAFEKAHAPEFAKRLFRPGGFLISLIIANEDEDASVSAKGTPIGQPASADDVISAFNQRIRPWGGKRFFGFNIVAMDDKCAAENSPDAEKAPIIMELADKTTGPEGNISICAEDYGPGLERISRLAANLVKNTADIEEPFEKPSLRVEFLKGDPVKWRLSGRRIFFENIDQPKEVRISYRAIAY